MNIIFCTDSSLQIGSGDRYKIQAEFKKGREERSIEIAIEMIKDSEANEKITKYTSLSEDEIERLRGEV